MEQTPIEKVGRSKRVIAALSALMMSSLATFSSLATIDNLTESRSANAEMVTLEADYHGSANLEDLDFKLEEMKQAQERADELRRLQIATWNKAVWINAAHHIAYDPAFWERNHECEQPDSWHAGGYFGNGEPSSGGGEGMSMDAWHMAVRDAALRGVLLPPTAWNASVDQQMEAAQVFLEDEGWGWGCRRPW